MGRGNWTPAVEFGHRPANDPTCCEVVYIDLGLDDPESEEIDAATRVLHQLICERMPDLLYNITSDSTMARPKNMVGGGDYVIAYNERVVVCGDQQGEHWSMGVGVVVNHYAHEEDGDAGPLAELEALATSKTLFRFLADMYPGRVFTRDGPWRRTLLPGDGVVSSRCIGG